MKNRSAFEGSLHGPKISSVWRALRGGRTVSIAALAAAAGIDSAGLTPREVQMRVGGYLSVLNARLDNYGTGARIAPGTPRGTYRLFS